MNHNNNNNNNNNMNPNNNNHSNNSNHYYIGNLSTDNNINILNNNANFLNNNTGFTIVDSSSSSSSSSSDTNFINLPDCMKLEESFFATTVKSYIYPPVIIITIITNIIICIILMKKNMRNPTNTILVCMAISDMLTGLTALPMYIRFYIIYLGDYIPYHLCYHYIYLINFMPTIFHTASVWLTVTLAIHRYISVCHPQAAKRLCSRGNTRLSIIIVYFLSIASQMTRFFESSYLPAVVIETPDQLLYHNQLQLQQHLHRQRQDELYQQQQQQQNELYKQQQQLQQYQQQQHNELYQQQQLQQYQQQQQHNELYKQQQLQQYQQQIQQNELYQQQQIQQNSRVQLHSQLQQYQQQHQQQQQQQHRQQQSYGHIRQKRIKEFSEDFEADKFYINVHSLVVKINSSDREFNSTYPDIENHSSIENFINSSNFTRNFSKIGKENIEENIYNINNDDGHLTEFCISQQTFMHLKQSLKQHLQLSSPSSSLSSSSSFSQTTTSSSSFNPTSPPTSESSDATTAASTTTLELIAGRQFIGCLEQQRDFATAYDHLYYQIYYAARVVLIHFVPCSLLIILNALLINTMRQAKRRRLQLLKMNRRSECRRLAESTLTTFMLVVVVGVFLIVEVPMAVVFTMMMFDNSLKLELFSPNLSEHLTGIANLFILVSYPSNFFIYCVMSTRFRDTFKQLICCSRSRSSSHNSCCSSSLGCKGIRGSSSSSSSSSCCCCCGCFGGGGYSNSCCRSTDSSSWNITSNSGSCSRGSIIVSNNIRRRKKKNDKDAAARAAAIALLNRGLVTGKCTNITKIDDVIFDGEAGVVGGDVVVVAAAAAAADVANGGFGVSIGDKDAVDDVVDVVDVVNNDDGGVVFGGGDVINTNVCDVSNDNGVHIDKNNNYNNRNNNKNNNNNNNSDNDKIP